MDLTHLAIGKQAQVTGISPRADGDAIARRLLDLGFVAGESVSCIALAPWGGDPMLVQIGFTRFALRRSEAARIQIEDVA
jgi:ferrous iron transport protein A